MSRGIQQSSSLLSKFFSTYSFIQIWLSYRYFQIFTLEKVTWILFESKKLGVVGSMKDVLSFVFSKFLSFSRKRERKGKKKKFPSSCSLYSITSRSFRGKNPSVRTRIHFTPHNL